MSHARYSHEEIARRGRELYEQRIRSQVEREENIGKIVSIDIETGDYEVVDDVGIASSRRLQAKNPEAAIWAERIGYDAAYALGGTLTRVAMDPRPLLGTSLLDGNEACIQFTDGGLVTIDRL